MVTNSGLSIRAAEKGVLVGNTPLACRFG